MRIRTVQNPKRIYYFESNCHYHHGNDTIAEQVAEYENNMGRTGKHVPET